MARDTVRRVDVDARASERASERAIRVVRHDDDRGGDADDDGDARAMGARGRIRTRSASTFASARARDAGRLRGSRARGDDDGDVVVEGRFARGAREDSRDGEGRRARRGRGRGDVVGARDAHAGTTALALAVAFATTVGTPDAALAARSGGRMGGGSFRASSMSSFRAPRRRRSGTSSYSAPSVGAPITRTSSFMVGPGFGYGFGMGPGLYFGGGGFFNFIFFAMMLFVSNALQNLTGGGGFGDGLTAGGDSISVVKIQVGLLGTARSLQRSRTHRG